MHNEPLSIPQPSLFGLGPILSETTRILILCSYPGKASFEKKEYYATPQNQFWILISRVLNADLLEKSYEDKLKTLLKHGIGLWDVVSACQSKGSLKSLLSDKNKGRFAFLKNHSPQIQKICFNGKPAGEYAPLFEEAGYRTLILPSSSPSYSKQPLEKKLQIWKQIL